MPIPQASFDWAPLAALMLLGAALALGPLGWVWFRHRASTRSARLRALTLLALFLTFDLVLFGAFTRLSDSGLGCPDWPGCYGSASPLGAQAQISAEERAVPTGAVTVAKAWIEMTHRYLASAVGFLLAVLAALRWLARRDEAAANPWWAIATLAWVCAQGAFGALTVTMKLYPAIVTLHLLGGIGLLGLLAAQLAARPRLALAASSRRLAAGVAAVLLLVAVQAALGGWVSANYAVLACRDFPTCHGVWWPAMDFASGFEVLRPLGRGGDGEYVPFAALTAIHVAHRAGAAVVFLAIGCLAFAIRRSGDRRLLRWAAAIAAVAVWQLASGVGNVVFGWPLAAALAHTAGAAALVAILSALLALLLCAPRPARAARSARPPAAAHRLAS